MPLLKTPLTAAEKVAGRLFRATQQEQLTESFETDPPTYACMSWLGHWRHECPGRNDISTAIELKEKYVYSPEIYVAEGQEDMRSEPVLFAVLHPDDIGVAHLVGTIPAGRFGFWYRVGKCKSKGCGHTARSKTGVFVKDAAERPPIEGRVARQ